MTCVCVKRSLKRDPSVPVGVSAPLYLDCECGYRLSIPNIAESPTSRLVKACVCGIWYDHSGWIVKRPEVKP